MIIMHKLVFCDVFIEKSSGIIKFFQWIYNTSVLENENMPVR